MVSQEAARRDLIYKKLARRNRLIGFLRIGMPVFGAMVFVALVSQIIIGNLAEEYGFGGVRIVRDELTVDTPAYSGVMANGSRYTVSAQSASTPIGRSDQIALVDAVLDLERLDGYTMHAEAAEAQFSLDNQTVVVDDLLDFTDSRGTRSKLRDTVIDWTEQTLVARDNVHVIFNDGSELTAGGLTYDAEKMTWDFSLVKLTTAAE